MNLGLRRLRLGLAGGEHDLDLREEGSTPGLLRLPRRWRGVDLIPLIDWLFGGPGSGQLSGGGFVAAELEHLGRPIVLVRPHHSSAPAIVEVHRAALTDIDRAHTVELCAASADSGPRSLQGALLAGGGLLGLSDSSEAATATRLIRFAVMPRGSLANPLLSERLRVRRLLRELCGLEPEHINRTRQLIGELESWASEAPTGAANGGGWPEELQSSLASSSAAHRAVRSRAGELTLLKAERARQALDREQAWQWNEALLALRRAHGSAGRACESCRLATHRKPARDAAGRRG